MIYRYQTALLSIQVILVCPGCAGPVVESHMERLVYRGDSVTLTCNISVKHLLQIHWTKDRFQFTHNTQINQTFSNFTCDRLRIHLDLQSNLTIDDAQHDDAGLYKCFASEQIGPRKTTFNLTVAEKEIISSLELRYLMYTLTPLGGLLLIGMTSVVCLCRKRRGRTPTQHQVQDQINPQSEREVADSNSRTKNKKRGQYQERLNSIYGHA